MKPFEEIDYTAAGFGDIYDELPLWSAAFGRLMLEKVPMRRGMTILDAGAGTGFLAIELAQRCGPDSLVYAVDPWQAGMQRLRSKLSALGLKNVRLLEHDIRNIDLSNESCDLIVSNLGINNFEDPEAALRTCRRVLKPNGRLFLTTNLLGHMAEFYAAFRDVLVKLDMTECIATLNDHIHHRATLDSVRSLLDRAGFRFLEATTTEFHERFADGTSLFEHFFIRLGFLSGWRRIVPVEKVDSVFAELESHLNDMASTSEGLCLTIPVACMEAG